MKKALIISMVLLLTMLTVQAAYAEPVTGNLIYASSQKPVAGARVMITDDQGIPVVRTTTDAAGDFSLPRLEPGIYRIVVFSSTRGTQILAEMISVVPGENVDLYFEVGAKKTLWGQASKYNYTN